MTAQRTEGVVLVGLVVDAVGESGRRAVDDDVVDLADPQPGRAAVDVRGPGDVPDLDAARREVRPQLGDVVEPHLPDAMCRWLAMIRTRAPAVVSVAVIGSGVVKADMSDGVPRSPPGQRADGDTQRGRHLADTWPRHIHGMSSVVRTRAEVRGERFTAATAGVVRRLPWGLATVVPPSLLGFAVINGFTFGVDLALLAVLRSVAHLPLWLSVTVAYACAFGLSYALNRALNFRSHAPVGPQVAVYVVVVVVNYLVWILWVCTGLAALGVDYRLARLAAGAGEAVYMYCALRRLVFRNR
jgi:putative flippase GtrA